MEKNKGTNKKLWKSWLAMLMVVLMTVSMAVPALATDVVTTEIPLGDSLDQTAVVTPETTIEGELPEAKVTSEPTKGEPQEAKVIPELKVTPEPTEGASSEAKVTPEETPAMQENTAKPDVAPAMASSFGVFSTENPNFTYNARWAGDHGLIFDKNNYDTMQYDDKFELDISFAVTLATTERSVSINVPRGLIVDTYSNTVGSEHFDSVVKTGDYNESGGTTITYNVKEGIAFDKAEVRVVIRNNTGAYVDDAANSSAALYGPGKIIPITTTYNYKTGGVPDSSSATYDLKVKPFDIKFTNNAGYHVVGTGTLGNNYPQTDIDLCSFDSGWYEAEALQQDGVVQTMFALYTIADAARNRMSYVKDLRVEIPLPAGVVYKGVKEIYPSSTNTNVAPDPTAKFFTNDYTCIYNSVPHTVTVVFNSGLNGHLIRRAMAGPEQLLPLELEKTNANPGETYTALGNIKFYATDADGIIHTVDTNQKLTINTHERPTTEDAYAPPAPWSGDMFIGKPDAATVLTVGGINRPRIDLTTRPYLYEDVVFTAEIADGIIPQTISWAGIDWRPGTTPFKVNIKYTTYGNPTPVLLTTLDCADTQMDVGDSLVLPTPAELGGDIITTVFFEIDQLGTSQNNPALGYANGRGMDPIFRITGVADTAYRDGNAIEDGDARTSTITFDAANLSAPRVQTGTITYLDEADRLTAEVASVAGEYMLMSETLTLPIFKNVDVKNPLGGSTHDNADISVKPCNGIAITDIGAKVGDAASSFSGATVFLSNGTSVPINLLTAYRVPGGLTITEVVFHATEIKEKENVSLPIGFSAPHQPYPLDDGTKTNIFEISVTSDLRPVATGTSYCALRITDAMEYNYRWLAPIYSASPTVATIGDGQVFEVRSNESLHGLGLPSTAPLNTGVMGAEYYVPLTKFGILYKIDKNFDYVPGSIIHPAALGSVVEAVIPEFFADGDTLLRFDFSGSTIKCTVGSTARAMVEFKLMAKLNAENGSKDAINAQATEVFGVALNKSVSNITGRGTIKVTGGRTGTIFDDAMYDGLVNTLRDDKLKLDLNPRSVVGVFNYGASVEDAALGAGPYSGWASEEFRYVFNVFSGTGSAMTNFVAYIPLAKTGANPLGALASANEFDFRLTSWPDISEVDGDYKIYYTTDVNPTMGGDMGGVESTFIEGTPPVLADVTMVKITAASIPDQISSVIPFTLKASNKPAGMPRSRMISFFDFDGYTQYGKTIPIEYNLYTSSIAGSVWLDKDYSANKSGGDPNLAGITVNLYKSDDTTTVVDSVLTNASGNYVFNDHAAGEYVIGMASLPTGQKLVVKSGDSILDPTTKFSDPLTIDVGTTITGQNFGLVDIRTLDPFTNLTLSVGETSSTITPVVGPSYLTGITFTHTKTPDTVTPADVTINANTDGSFTITGNTQGKATITVSIPDGFGGTVSKSFVVTVASNVSYTVYYYKDAITNDSDPNFLGSSTTVTGGMVGDRITLTTSSTPGLNAYKPVGYQDGVQSGGTSLVNGDNVINVLYSKQGDLTYIVKYYRDSITTGNALGSSVIGPKTFGDTISIAAGTSAGQLDHMLPNGYTTGRVDGSSVTTVGATSADNVVNVIYDKKDDLTYTVNYYTDSVAGGNLISGGTWTSGAQTFGDTITIASGVAGGELDYKKPATGYISGVVVLGSATSVGDPSINNVVNVVYTKKTDLTYTINYYKDSVDGANFLGSWMSGNVTFDTAINVGTGSSAGAIDFKKPATGYDTGIIALGSVTTIGDPSTDNVVNVIYSKKDNLSYSVVYYQGSVNPNNILETWTSSANQTFESAISIGAGTGAGELDYKMPSHGYQAGVVAFGSATQVGDPSGNNVVRVVYAPKDNLTYTVKYYLDSLHNDTLIDTWTSANSEVYGTSINIGAGTTDGELDFKKPATGYNSGVVHATSSATIGDPDSDNVIHVIYQKKGDLTYTVNYYMDEVTADNLITSGTWTSMGLTFGASINIGPGTDAGQLDYKRPAKGYKSGLVDALTSSTTIDDPSSNNVLNVVYTKKDSLKYTVKYYKDSLSDSNLLNTWASGDKTFEEAISVGAGSGAGELDFKKPATGYNGGVVEESSSTTIDDPSENNVIHVIYQRKGDLTYTVNYYKGSISDSNKVGTWTSAGLVYGDTIHVGAGKSKGQLDYKLPKGYKSGAIDAKTSATTIGDPSEDNVVNVIYEQEAEDKDGNNNGNNGGNDNNSGSGSNGSNGNNGGSGSNGSNGLGNNNRPSIGSTAGKGNAQWASVAKTNDTNNIWLYLSLMAIGIVISTKLVLAKKYRRKAR